MKYLGMAKTQWQRTGRIGALLTGLLAAAAGNAGAAADLLISEYVEGSSNNKALEFYNGTNAPIDLAAGGYVLKMYFNGSTSANASSTVYLTGIVQPGATFVLAHAAADASILAVANQLSSSMSSAWFNGDDALELTRNGVVIDSIGQVGVDPGAEWGTGLVSTADNTLRRQTRVSMGRTDSQAAFNPALEWDGFAQNTFDGLGSHSGGSTDTDTAPFVASSVPAQSATGVAANAAITLNFSETVQFNGTGLMLQCASSGPQALQLSGAGAAYQLTPSAGLMAGEACQLTVPAAQVADVDGAADAMASDFVLQFTVQGAATGCSAPFTPAYVIQGRGPATSLSGVVTTQGVVVGDFEGPSPALRGFYLQDPTGDGDSATSDAVFVFNGNNDNVQVGQLVRVTGTVGEYQEQTQVSASSVELCGNAHVAPTDIMLPMASSDDFERFEGMLVRLPQTLYVTEHYQLGRFGQVVLSVDARQKQPTNVVLPGADALALQAQNNLGRIILDDNTNAQNPDPILLGRNGQPLSASNTLRGGDSTTGVVGVLTYTWSGNAASGNAWRIRPMAALGGALPNFQANNVRPDPVAPAADHLRVAGVNVLNYFNTFSGCTSGFGGAATDCRGAEDATEFTRQQAKTVAALAAMEADVVGLVEIENDGYGSTSAMRNLVDALNAATSPGSFAVLDVDARTGQTNAMGSDAIKVGFIYRAARVTPVGTTAVLNSVAFQNGGDSAPRNRPAVAQAFQQLGGSGAGERFIAVVNHLKSKGSACDAPDAGDGQGNCNAVRLNAVNLLRSWLASNPTGTNDADVLVIGDLNAYAKEDPIRSFTDNAWVNLVESLEGADAYSYVFDGQWGYLDHALATPTMAQQVSRVVQWHINADEPAVLDYNTNFKSVAQINNLFAADAYRNSDHDPVLVDLRLLPAGSCAHPDPSPVVVFGSASTGVVNRVVDKGCTIDDLIGDEQPWSSQSAFLQHVSKVSVDLLQRRVISAAERSKLMAAAIASGIGQPAAR